MKIKALLAIVLSLAAALTLRAQGPVYEGGIPRGATSTADGPVFNVLNYGYKADWRQNSAADGTCSGGTTALGSATIAFTQSDVGKHVVIFVSGSATIGGGDLTIASVQSATAATLSGNIPSCGSSGSYSIAVFTDNGAALNAAENACVAAKYGMVYIPSGDAGTVSRFFFNTTSTSRCSYVGQGTSYSSNFQGVTSIHISPWTPFVGNNLMAFLGSNQMRDIMFDGMGAPWPNVANNTIATWSGAAALDHIAYNNFAFTNASDTVCSVNSDDMYAADLECFATGFPGPGGTALLIHSLYFNCISCFISGEPAVTATDMGNSSLIGGTYNGAAGTAFNLTGSSGGGKTNILADARIISTGTTNGTAAIVYATNITMDLQNVTFDNQGTNSVVVMNVPASMTVPIPNVGGVRQRGTGSTEIMNIVGSIHDAGGDDNFTVTGGGQILGNSGSNGVTALCAAVGSGANPSVSACGAAASGIVSCAVLSVGNCTVNTTAVTAKSGIQIWQDASTSTGTALGVTCNVTVSAVLPIITTRVSGTSFSFAITTPVTNPDCFDFEITN